MWCAYAFALFDLISLPDAIRAGTAAVVSWVAQTFLQLVLLSVIMVGQNVQAAAADKRAEATFHDASATLHEVAHVQGHLAAQDLLLTRIAEKIGLDPVPIIDNPPDDAATAEADQDEARPPRQHRKWLDSHIDSRRYENLRLAHARLPPAAPKGEVNLLCAVLVC